MSEVGRKPAPAGAHDVPERNAQADAGPAPSALQPRDRGQPLRDPMAPVRHERQQASMQIQRSLSAWRQAGGAAPPAPVRAAVEREVGADLSGVRVHADGDAAASAGALGARAFTVGQDVHFGAGQLRPGTRGGDQLIAHELAHAARPEARVQRAPDPTKTPTVDVPASQPHEPGEKGADAVGERVADKLHGDQGAAASSFQSRGEKADAKAAALEGERGGEQADAIAQLRRQTRQLATDAVTGLSSRGVLSATLEDVIAHIGQTPEQAFFVSADIKNLGGLNGTFGTSAANRHFRAMTDRFMQTLTGALGGARVIGYRLGGDEFGAVVVGHVDAGRVSAAVKAADAAIAAYVAGTVEQRLDGSGEVRLADIDHPKHLGDPAYRGTGVIVADIQITPKMKPADVLQVMDAVDLRKRASGSAEEGAAMASAPKLPAGLDDKGQRGSPPPPAADGKEAAPPEARPDARAKSDGGKPGDGKADAAKGDGKADAANGDAASQTKSKFSTGAERNDAKLGALIAQLPPEKAEAVRELQQTSQRLTTDAVTGLSSRGTLTATLEDVLRFLGSADGEQAFFVSADVKNLGGLNAALGTSAADRHFRAMTDLFQQRLHGALGGARVIGYRLGGDEFGAVIVGHVDLGRVRSAVAAADGAVRAYVQSARDKELSTGKETRLADIEHPKHRGDAAYRGTGVIFAEIQILPTMTPDTVLAVMDAVDLKKRGEGGS